MVTIQIIKTGEVKQVERNIAHDLIDKGEARLVNKKIVDMQENKEQTFREHKYPSRQMKSPKTS